MPISSIPHPDHRGSSPARSSGSRSSGARSSGSRSSGSRRSGSQRYPRALLGALSPKTLLVILAAALGLLLGSSPAWAASGRLSVANDRSEPVLLQVDRDGMGQVAARSQTSIVLRPGRHEVVLRSRAGQVLHRSVELVHPGSTTMVRLAAIDAPVRVVNPLDRTVRILVDGRERAVLPAYASTTLVLDLGRRSLDLVLDGRSIARQDLVVHSGPSQTWAPQPKLVGDLFVRNPLPIPVTLTCSRGLSRTLAPFEATSYAGLGEGTFALTVRRADGGELLAELRPRVRAFDTVSVEVPQPTKGVLAVQNERHRSTVRVYVDGRYAATLRPGEVERLQLSPGYHEVLVRHSEGQVLDRRTVRIDRYDVARLEVEPSRHHERPDHDHHERPGELALGLSWSSDGAQVAYSSSCAMP